MVRLSSYLILVFLTSRALSVYSQPAIDSLKQVLYETNDNKQRVDVLNELSAAVYDTDVSEGFKYASEAQEHSRNIKYTHGLKQSLILMGYRFTINGEFRTALNYYHQAANVDSSPRMICWAMGLL